MIYCVEIKRELEEKAVLHFSFEEEPTEIEVISKVRLSGLKFNMDYDDIQFYPIKVR